MVRHGQREGLVQALRKVAKKCGAQRVRKGNASRAGVEGMMANIRSSGGPDEEKAAAEGFFATYEATFDAESLGPPEDDGEGEGNEGGEEGAEGEEEPAGVGEGEEGEEGDGVSLDYRGVDL
jgi:hypothetical protein